MRKLSLLAAAFVFIFVLLALPILSDSRGQADFEELTVIRVAGDKNFPPFEYLSESGVYNGFNIDIMNAVSMETGLKIEYYPMTWHEAIEALNTGKVDAIQGMKYSPLRDKFYEFSEPYLTSSQGIFVLNKNMYIHELADLEGRKVALQKGDIANDLLSRLERTRFLTTESQEEAIQLLLEGEVDAFVGNRITGQYFIQRKNSQTMIKIVGEPIEPTDYGVVVLESNKELLNIFNKGISKIKRNGIYEKIEKKWFGEYVFLSSVKLQKALFYLKIGLSVIIIIFLIVLWWNRILKKEVARRTNEITAINNQLAEKMEQLEDNLHFQQQLLDSTYGCLITLDQSGKISMINRNAANYLQIGGEDSGQAVFATIIAEIIPAKEILDVLENGGVWISKETTWSTPASNASNQEKRIISYSIIPIRLASGVTTGAIISFQDVTEQRELEKKMAREDRLRSLGQLTLGIAHEIRNPLMSIQTSTELLPKKIDNLQFRQFFVKHIPEEIKRLNGLVNDLLDYARPRKSNPVRFPVGPLIDSILRLYQPACNEKGIEIVHVQERPVYAYADMQQIKQVLINVMMNAIEAVDESGKITVQSGYRNGFAIIEVEDNGKGMDEEEANRIFEPFYSSKASGVGLGLSISYQLIKQNRGSIEVKSSTGSGTRMAIQLPEMEEEEGNYASSDYH